MKKKSLKILASVLLILVMLMPYVQSIASSIEPAKQETLGAAGDVRTLRTANFLGGDEKTGTVPTTNSIYDKQGYYKYITSVTGITPPSGASSGEIYIRNIVSDHADDQFAEFYCLNPEKPFPPSAAGTTYTSLGMLADMSEAELNALLTKPATKAELLTLFNKFYLGRTIPNTDILNAYEKEQKDRSLGTLIDVHNSLDKAYQFLTDDDIKVAQQWALWKQTSNAEMPASPLLSRDLDNSGADHTPLGTDSYKVDRNAMNINLANGYGTVPAVGPIALTYTNDLSHKPFVDTNNVEYTDIGIFKINFNTSYKDRLLSIKLFDQNNQDITASGNYQIFMGDKDAQGTNFGIPALGSLTDHLHSDDFLNHNFFLRFPNSANISKIRIVVEYVSEIKTEAEIFEADDANHQNIVKLTRTPVILQEEVEYEIPELLVDLALRKFITEINGVAVDTRVPVVTEINEAIDKSVQTTAHYAHKKNPLIVKPGDTVTYKMRIYNESTKPANPTSVVDVLPKGLSLKTGAGINPNWSVVQTLSDGRTVLLYQPISGTPIPAAVKNAEDNYVMSYLEISVDILVDLDAPTGIELTNISFVNSQNESDIDSKPGSISKDGNHDIFDITNELLPDYRGYGNDGQTLDQPSRYYKGYEDDDDFEKVILRPFDLALRKYITEVNGTEVTPSREPVVDVTPLIDGTATTATYTHPKNPIKVQVGDVVKYKIRVYNEGGLAGYTKQITDHLPEGLGYIVNDKTNIANGWEQVAPPKAMLTEAEKAEMPFLSRVDLTEIAKPIDGGGYSDTENAASIAEIHIVKGPKAIATEILENQLIPAFDESQGVNGLSYVDVEVVSIVLEELKSLNLRNWAEISEDADENNNPITDRDSTPGNLPDHPGGPYEDDEDFEDLMTDYFDLALRKFITNVNDDADPNTSGDAVDREPVVDVTPLIDGTGTTAIYSHPKTPVEVQKGDLVTYRIRVYNEGNYDGFAKEITDHLPKGLGYLPQHTKNINNGWVIANATDSTAADYPGITFKFREADLDGVADLQNTVIAAGPAKITTNVRQNNLIPAFDPTQGANGLSYVDVEVVCVVLEDREYNNDSEYQGNLINWAEISEDADADGNPVTDRDSTPGNLPGHPGGPYEDDEDYEDLTTKPLIFDLALQKFITTIVSDSEARAKTPTELQDRFPIPVIDNDGNITYTKKDTTPPLVGVGDTVIYTIRVYNEGDIAGFAKAVRDDIPEGLTYLPEHEVNQKYQWVYIDENGNEVTEIENAKFLETYYLSRAAGMEREAAGEQPDVANTILLPFDKDAGTIHARDVQIAFKVNELAKPGANNLKNIAEISDDEDEHGNEVEDKDSTPGNEVPTEDDIDDEDLRVTYFDLALLKIVTKVELTENGKLREIFTGHTFEMNPEPVVKTDLDERYLDTTQIKYVYKIRVENQGEVAGYATKVGDYIPAGLEFHAEDQKNNTWSVVEPGFVETSDLADVLLQPGETATVEIVLRWINNRNNMGIKTNVAEITEDHNEFDLPDIDSVPGNRKPGEDDIDDASVLVSIRTGTGLTFFVISFTMASIVAAGTVLIRRYIV